MVTVHDLGSLPLLLCTKFPTFAERIFVDRNPKTKSSESIRFDFPEPFGPIIEVKLWKDHMFPLIFWFFASKPCETVRLTLYQSNFWNFPLLHSESSIYSNYLDLWGNLDVVEVAEEISTVFGWFTDKITCQCKQICIIVFSITFCILSIK